MVAKEVEDFIQELAVQLQAEMSARPFARNEGKFERLHRFEQFKLNLVLIGTINSYHNIKIHFSNSSRPISGAFSGWF